MKRSLAISSVAALLTFVGPAITQSAFAAGPTIDKKVPFSGSFDDEGETCSTFGVIFAYSGQRTFIDFYAANGTLLKEIRQITFTGTLTSDVNGASIPYAGRFVLTYDATQDTTTITGLTSTVNGIPVTTGRDGVGKDEFSQVVCAALSQRSVVGASPTTAR